MPRKVKFKPVITRIKLNPEQAVLQCECYNLGQIIGTTTFRGTVGFFGDFCRTYSKSQELSYNICANFSAPAGKYQAQNGASLS